MGGVAFVVPGLVLLGCGLVEVTVDARGRTGAIGAHAWQFALLGVAAIALLAFRRPVVLTLVAAGIAGAIAAGLGAPLP